MRTDKNLVIVDDGEPCPRQECASHVTRPCEVCGRKGARGKAFFVRHVPPLATIWRDMGHESRPEIYLSDDGQPLKALSIRQPWAWLIANGWKEIENRTWATKFRGPFLIHAGLRFDHRGYGWVLSKFPNITMPTPGDFPVGGIVGRAEILDCVEEHDNSPWFSGPYGFVLVNARPLPFVRCKGRLFFFDIEPMKLLDRLGAFRDDVVRVRARRLGDEEDKHANTR